MKELIIIGAGGMGRSVYNIAINSIGYKKEFIVKGFIDDNLKSLDEFKGYPPVLDAIDSYNIQSNDIFICSLGNVDIKKKVVEKIIHKKGAFIKLIHKKAIVNTNAVIGDGSIIAPLAYIGADAKIGEYCLIQSFATIGHDVIIGDFSRVDTHATLVGGIVVGEEVMIYTGAVINHRVTVENNSIVGAGSFVIRRVRTGTTVYGNPAKKL